MNFIESDEFIKAMPVIIPFITLIAGAWIGNRYAVFRDRRKEILAITAPINEALFRQMQNTDRQRVFAMSISGDELLRLRNYYINGTLIERIRGIGFDDAVSDYKKYGYLEHPRDEDGNYLEPVITDDHFDNYLNSIRKLIRYTPLR